MTKHSINRFKSIKDFADKARQGFDQAMGDENRRCVGNDGDNYGDWHGATSDFEEAYKAAVNGWQAGYVEVRATMDKVMPRVRENVDPGPVLVPEVYGDMYDIGEYLQGNPEFAWDQVYESNQADARVVSVLVSNALISSVDPLNVLHRGALVLACMEAMELLGHQLEVWSEITVQASSGDVDSILVRARAAGEPVDMRSIAFTCDPGWHRRLGFCYQETWSKAKRADFGIGSFYAYPKGPRCAKIVGANLVFDLGTSQGWPNRNATAQVQCDWVVEKLAELESFLKVGLQEEKGN
jgi:hypothetical protein